MLDCRTPRVPGLLIATGSEHRSPIACLNSALVRAGIESECVRTVVGGEGVVGRTRQRMRGHWKTGAGRVGESGKPSCAACISPMIGTNIKFLQMAAARIRTQTRR